jgi:hypothetical protein
MNLILPRLPSVLLAVLLCLMLRNRSYKLCPWFFAYVAFGNGASVARFLAYGHPHPYFATYWLTEAGFCLLGILGMHEVFRRVLGNLACAWRAELIFATVLFASVGLSLARAHAASPQFSGISQYIVVSELAVRCAQVLIFVATVATVLVVGLRRLQYALGVALGFGFYATVMLLNTTIFLNRGTGFKFLWGRISLASYSLAALIWIWSFTHPLPKRRRYAPPCGNPFPKPKLHIRRASTLRIRVPL